MASEVKPKPPKGILKASSSFDKPDHHDPDKKGMKWDEMNILATHHPADKDYGHMKIDEPKTPYNKMSDAEDDSEEGGRRHSVSEESGVNPQSLESRLEDVEASKGHARLAVEEEEESSSEDETESPEERAKRKVFEQKRKLHYNEFQAVKLAKQLMEEEDDDIDEEDEVDDEVKDQQQNKDTKMPETSSNDI